MVKRAPIETYCEKKISTLQKNAIGMIDYVDISSVDNTKKKIISFQTMNTKDAPSRAKQLLKKDDIIVSTVRPNLNAVAVVESETDNLMVGSTGYCVLRCKDNMDFRYLFNFCQSQYFIDDMSSQATGASYPAVSTTIVRSSLIPCYPVDEQRKIASELDKITDLIDKRKQQLEKLDELVKARFVELFGNGHDGKTPVKMLGSICKFQQGTQIPVEEQFEEQIAGYKRFLRIIDYTQAPQPPRYVNVNGKEVDEKSVVIVRYGATAGFVGRGYQGILANNLFEIIPDETILSKEFLFLALKYGTFEKEVHDKAFGAAMPALSFSMMNDIPVVVPMSEQQSKFVCFVEQTNKSKLEVQKSLEKLEVLKKALMQKYFG